MPVMPLLIPHHLRNIIPPVIFQIVQQAGVL